MITPRKNRIIMLPNKWALSLNVHWYCLLVNTHICEYNRNGLHDVVLSAAGSVLTRRQYQCTFNDRAHLFGSIIILFFLGVIMSTGYWRLSYDSLDVQNRVSLIFFMLLSSYMIAEPFFGRCTLIFQYYSPSK